MSRGELVLELLCEEIPANALAGARAQLVAAFTTELSAAGFVGFEVEAHSTVRRLVVVGKGIGLQQPDREEEVLGPPLRAAYASDGAPTQAALGFARAHGVAVDALRVVQGPKGEVIAATRRIAGKPAAEVLAAIVTRVVPELHFPKRMRWGQGEHVFVRPLHAIVALLGERGLRTVVPITLYGIDAGATTVGHRVASPGRVELMGVLGAAGYLERLASGGVVVDQTSRRRQLEARAIELAGEVGCEVRPDAALIDELVELVEYPGVIRGEIALRHLALPDEVLITTLRHHQKALVLTREGRIAPYFLAVCDRADDPEGAVQQGNEWVVGARLADAAFFFAQDRKRSLAGRVPALASVTFHPKVGTFLEKSALVRESALAIAREVGAPSAPVALAAELLKADLVTAMVGEFPELQGIVGGIYARLDGHADEVWQAIYDQYQPAGIEGRIPRGPVAAIVGVADRLDTLAAMFAAGEAPSGSRDPFALRRAALAVVRICAEAPLACDLRAQAARTLAARGAVASGGAAAVGPALLDF
ncbi:MAG: glycine--tRNA ligase subunit beta, partial [Acidobacteriota bacterium]